MYVMVMKMLWNGHGIIFWLCYCSFIMVPVVIEWLVMVHSLCLNSLCLERLWTYEDKRVVLLGKVHILEEDISLGVRMEDILEVARILHIVGMMDVHIEVLVMEFHVVVYMKNMIWTTTI